MYTIMCLRRNSSDTQRYRLGVNGLVSCTNTLLSMPLMHSMSLANSSQCANYACR